MAIDRAAYNVTTSSDPVIQELAERDEATIFATDSILSMLMCSPRSVYPWDIVIVRQGNKIFLDKRDNANLDMVTVNENAADAPLDAADGSKDALNQPGALAEEATYINHNFANQVVAESESAKIDMAHANPFYNASEDTDPPASMAYKYRRFDLSTNDEEPVYLVVRTEIDAVQKNAISGEDQLVTIKALNEFDSKAQGSGGALDWRSKLVTQRGAVVATEMKNNSCKLARWTVQSILSKSDVMKLGYAPSRNPRAIQAHSVSFLLISLTACSLLCLSNSLANPSAQFRLPRQPPLQRQARHPRRRRLEAPRLRQPDEPLPVQRLGHRPHHRRHVPQARGRQVRPRQGPQQVHPASLRAPRRQPRGRRGGGAGGAAARRGRRGVEEQEVRWRGRTDRTGRDVGHAHEFDEGWKGGRGKERAGISGSV